jgi:UDP-GlcNAc:undecaprenyl-phosphate GlcNAc-1-phosphate transferase
MNIVLHHFLSCLLGFLVTAVGIRIMDAMAFSLQLVDKPNHRKMHDNPVPIIGGICIAAGSFLVLAGVEYFTPGTLKDAYIFQVAAMLLLVGILDDRFDMPALIKLMLQIICAVLIAAHGIRLTSFYGLFGIYQLPLIIQYILTIGIITGVVNAMNLMDGIDGLAGSLSVIGFIILGVLFTREGNPHAVTAITVIVGAILAFLRRNLGKKKIFMGDAGSLFLGFLLVVFSLKVLPPSGHFHGYHPSKALPYVLGIFMIPVLDSLRVFRSRMKRGLSPFSADRTHLHHLFMLMGLNHKKTTFIILIASVLLLFIVNIFNYYFSITVSLLVAVTYYCFIVKILNINKGLTEWREKLKIMERN